MLDSDPSWDSLADHLVYYDEAKIHNCDKNLDNLLVFVEFIHLPLINETVYSVS